MELLGEEVDTEVTMLASLCRCCDADDLARTTLKDQEIADADVVSGDGDGIWSITTFVTSTFNITIRFIGTFTSTRMSRFFAINHNLLTVMMVVMVERM